MDLIPTISEYATDTAAQTVWGRLDETLREEEGKAFYRHPNLGLGTGAVADFTVLTRNLGVIAVVIFRHDIEALDEAAEEHWTVSGDDIQAPPLQLDDLQVRLKYRFDQRRQIRDRVPVNLVLALPLITKNEYLTKFGESLAEEMGFIWRDRESDSLDLDSPREPLSDGDWRLAQSLFQSADVLTRESASPESSSPSLGKAIRLLDRHIALFDDQQERVALQIPPGPQCIRGLAGTGKTALLAMKAATIHGNYPDKQVLFTFNTQSLYNQARDLISRFYRMNKESDPDWTRLHVRHGWGGRRNPGVYSDLSARQGVPTLTLRAAKSRDGNVPFRPCCQEALRHRIAPEYDFVLVDEAQDFPSEFFQVLYKLAAAPKCIYYAFDELQSLTDVELPTTSRLFGVDEAGQPLVDLEGEYPGPIEKTIVLRKSYRCPRKVLMLAHAIGLGIYSDRGCVQMISRADTWSSIGYEVESGELTAGARVVLHRPEANSPNRVEQVYSGEDDLVTVSVFESRDQELRDVARRVAADVRNQGVPPERILVISLDSLRAKEYLAQVQQVLLESDIASVIPGLIDDSDAFAEPNRVTLSTVFRAKGNEAPVVYIISCDSLIDYVHGFKMRNNAFTSISRSKGWVRISGTGSKMHEAKKEIDAILADVPRFRFEFPNMAAILRNLDQTVAVRKRAVRTARQSIEELSRVDEGALLELPPEQVEALLRRLKSVRERHGGDQSDT